MNAEWYAEMSELTTERGRVLKMLGNWNTKLSKIDERIGVLTGLSRATEPVQVNEPAQVTEEAA